MTIQKCYMWLSVLTLILSIIGPIILIEETMEERILIGVLMNLQFHLVFQLLSRVPVGMYQYVVKENPGIKVFAGKFLVFISWMVMILAIVGCAGLLSAALNDPPKLLATMTFTAMFLGGYSSKAKFNED